MRNLARTAAVLAAMIIAAGGAVGQEVVDRIVVKIESDIILMSDVQRLARYQIFLDGKAQKDSEILDRLIDQWIVRNEAQVARFPQPSEDDVDRSIQRLKRSFSSPEEYEARKTQSGLTDEQIRELVKSQLYLSNYLDSRFRPVIQIQEKAIEDFYDNRVVPRAKSRGQTPPTLENARDFIQEALVQRAINEQADKWLKESRSRVRIEILLNEKAQ
ncbi:MAG TPA: hypothetical protein VL128_08990 [Candidatus Eisenbacteria bacterium]|nr:hypothetical protein [Candidatus Eisenbacteria bacterium]